MFMDMDTGCPAARDSQGIALVIDNDTMVVEVICSADGECDDNRHQCSP
jgi:hypothetical protein